MKKRLMDRCHLCNGKEVIERLDLGIQPICNRFLTEPTDEEYVYPMIISQCKVCGLVQISNPVPVDEVLPRYEWITYNEPEGHLDHLVEIVLALPVLSSKSKICGVSFKDDSTLLRFRKKGFEHIWRIDPKADLGISDSKAGLESIQKFFTPEAANMIVKKHGIFDVVIVRHILEHTHNARIFMQALKQLISPDGYIIFEVPDCKEALEKCDYTSLWEEHIIYFTPETFKNCFAYSDFSLYRFECYPNTFENSLVGIVQSQGRTMPSFFSDNVLETELYRVRIFAKNFKKQAEKFKKFFSEYHWNKGKIALFGAGHLACVFINLFELKDFIDFCVDDNPNKRGFFLPGSQLPIYESSALTKENIKLCLLSLNPMSEDKVISAHHDFIDQGGTFASIFHASKCALRI